MTLTPEQLKNVSAVRAYISRLRRDRQRYAEDYLNYIYDRYNLGMTEPIAAQYDIHPLSAATSIEQRIHKILDGEDPGFRTSKWVKHLHETERQRGRMNAPKIVMSYHDDWIVNVLLTDGRVYSFVTEMWPEHGDAPNGEHDRNWTGVVRTAERLALDCDAQFADVVSRFHASNRTRIPQGDGPHLRAHWRRRLQSVHAALGAKFDGHLLTTLGTSRRQVLCRWH